MRKFYSLVAAAIVAFSANAQAVTESFGSATIDGLSKDTDVTCPGFVIPGTYFAAGASKVDVYNGDKGMKLRTNKEGDKITFNVDAATTITKLVMGMVTNNGESSVKLTAIAIDDVEVAGFTPVVTFNTADATGAAVVNLENISAKKTITFSFDNSGLVEGANKQVFVAGEVTYEKGEAGIANVTVAEDENAPMYNLQGVQVDENYKGVVIKNGKKFINK